jgi:nucleoside 2-deoxyribosyltransferase
MLGYFVINSSFQGGHLMSTKKIYVASPFGFSEAGKSFMYDQLLPVILAHGFEVIDPWKMAPLDRIEAVQRMSPGPDRIREWKEINRIIGKTNEAGIRRSDGLIAVLDGSDVDSGVAGEIGFGAGLEKKVIGYRGDFRPAGENEGCLVNLQIEHFIYMNEGLIVRSLDELSAILVGAFA